MSDMPLNDEQCDRLVHTMMRKLAQKANCEPEDLNANLIEHDALRRSLVNAAYMLGAMETNAMLPENATEPMQKAMQRAVMMRKSMNDVWRAALAEAGYLGPNVLVTRTQRPA